MNNTYSAALPSGLERLKLVLKAIPVKRTLKVSGAFLVLIIRLSFGLLAAALTLGAHVLAAVSNSDDEHEMKDQPGDPFLDLDTDEVHGMRTASSYNTRTGR